MPFCKGSIWWYICSYLALLAIRSSELNLINSKTRFNCCEIALQIFVIVDNNLFSEGS